MNEPAGPVEPREEEGRHDAEPESDPATSEPAPSAEPEEQADGATGGEGDLEVYRDRLARLTAEFQNFRKRTEREKSLWREHLSRELFTELLPVLDDFDRALDARETTTLEAMRAGLEMMASRLRNLMQRFDVHEIEAAGQPFDHDVHQAILQVERDDLPERTVVDVVEKGYRLGQHLLRAAKVTVATGGAPAAGEATTQEHPEGEAPETED
jgi:molecular chaperone GrpE